MATEEIWALNSQNNQNEIIRLLSQDANLNQDTKRGLQKLTVTLNSWQQELNKAFNEIVIPHLVEQDVHEMNLLHKAKQEKQEQIRANMRSFWLSQNNAAAAARVPQVEKSLHTKHIILKNDFVIKGFDPSKGTYIEPLLLEGKVAVSDYL